MRITATWASGAACSAWRVVRVECKTPGEAVKEAPNNTWVSITGTVTSSTAWTFLLDYGDGVITVEMDDFDSFPEGHQLFNDDKMIVFGRVDEDPFEKRRIEAASVFVEDLGTFFHAGPLDEEDFHHWNASVPLNAGRLELSGEVTAIDGREITLEVGNTKLIVDTGEMHINPVDNAGYLRVRPGDRIKVVGTMDHGLFERTEVMADVLIKLDY